MMADSYNALIQQFGASFDDFSTKELATVCAALGDAGLT